MSEGGTEPVILLVDNCPAHMPPLQAILWKSGNLKGYKLSNLLVVYCQPNCTSKVQPLDAGCIQSAKAMYRKRHMRWILDQLENGEGSNNAPEIRCNLR